MLIELLISDKYKALDAYSDNREVSTQLNQSTDFIGYFKSIYNFDLSPFFSEMDLSTGVCEINTSSAVNQVTLLISGNIKKIKITAKNSIYKVKIELIKRSQKNYEQLFNIPIDIQAKSIDCLNMDSRIVRALKSNSRRIIADLLSDSEKKLSYLPGIGRRTSQTITSRLDSVSNLQII
jgi:hypothetical protein